MSLTKRVIEEKEEGWASLGKRCEMCKMEIPFGDRETFFDTGLCVVCDNFLKKDD